MADVRVIVLIVFSSCCGIIVVVGKICIPATGIYICCRQSSIREGCSVYFHLQYQDDKLKQGVEKVQTQDYTSKSPDVVSCAGLHNKASSPIQKQSSNESAYLSGRVAEIELAIERAEVSLWSQYSLQYDNVCLSSPSHVDLRNWISI